LQSNPDVKTHHLSPIQLYEQKLYLSRHLELAPQFPVKEVNIFNLHCIKCVGVDMADVTRRTEISAFNAVKVAFKYVGIMQQVVPRLTICKLKEHQICDTLLVS